MNRKSLHNHPRRFWITMPVKAWIDEAAADQDLRGRRDGSHPQLSLRRREVRSSLTLASMPRSVGQRVAKYLQHPTERGEV